MKKSVIVLFCFFMSVVAGYCQEDTMDFKIPIVDVEGLEIFDELDYDGFVMKFGKPDTYKKEVGQTEIWYEEYYSIGKDRFTFGNAGHFREFYLEEKKYAALTLTVNGGVRVGDPLSKLDDYEYGKPKFYKKMEKEGTLLYTLFDYSESWLIIEVLNGKIVSMSYSLMD